MTKQSIPGVERLAALGRKEKKILSVYMTAGFPVPGSTVDILEELERNGADMIEVGFPFSDPIADGPAIQMSNQVSLQNGMTLGVLFEELSDVRSRISVPLVLMGSLNPVLQFGMDRFLEACAQLGIDGTILPDLPAEEYERRYAGAFRSRGISNIFLLTTRTDPARAKYLDSLSSSFLYLVSAEGVTGGSLQVDDDRNARLERMAGMGLRHPMLVGFGIRDRASFEAASRHHAGAVIGTAFIKALEGEGTLGAKVKSFMSGIRGE